MHLEISPTRDGRDWKCTFIAQRADQKKVIIKQRLPIKNTDPELCEYLIDLIDDTVGGKQKNYALYRQYALHYSETMIRRAIGEFKELSAQGNIRKKEAYFTAIMHTLCHKMNVPWINACDKHCKYRPENQLFPT